MGRVLLGIVIGIALVAGGFYVYFTTGMAPAAAKAAPMPLERYFANAALRARIGREAPKAVPIQATPENLLEGAHVYKQYCEYCHGAPGSAGSQEGRGMFPDAPQFFAPRPNLGRARGARSAGGPEEGARGREGGREGGGGRGRGPELGGDYWRVKNGIRLTGMPSYEGILTDQQMWDAVVMLSQRRNLPPAVSAALAPEPSTPAPAATPAKPASSDDK